MPMRDHELCALIDREARAAIGVDDTFASDRATAMDFYMGEAKGELAPPAVQGRSRVVSKDLMDTVEWAMPGLMEALTGDEIITFEPDAEADEQGADDATKYVNHLIYERNNGFVTLHDAIKSCLIVRMGVVKVYCDKSSVQKTEKYKGLTPEQVQALQQDTEIEVVEVVASAYGGAFDVTAKRTEGREKFVCEGVPPEEIRISKDCRTIDDLRFIEHRVQRTRSDLISEGWPKAEVMRLPKAGNDNRGDEEYEQRHAYDDSDDTGNQPDPSQELVAVQEAYIRLDYDDDGVAEFRRVLKSGTYIHENEETDDHPFALFSPILMPYKVIGLSFYDLVEDLQRIKTALTRATLDNVYLTNTPMKEVFEGKVNLDDLLNPRLGGIVRVKEMGAVREMTTPFMAQHSLTLIEHVNQVRDTRTGVTETNSALNAESLAKGQVGSEGVQSLMQAGAQRQKLIARVLAETGLKRMFQLMLKVVTQYQDRPAQIKLNGRWLAMSPSEWRTSYRTNVHVGLGAHEKALQVQNLMLLGQAQEKAMAMGLVQPQNVHHLLSRLCRAMGYKDSDNYFSPPNPNPPPQPPPIELQVEQMRQQGAQQLAQTKGQVDIQVENMRQQAQDAQSQRELAMQAERDREKMQNEMALERYKAELAMQAGIQKAQIAHQTAIETARIGAQAQVVGNAMTPRDDGQS